MAIIGRGALLALSMFLAGCAGLDRPAGVAGEYPDEVYGRGDWHTERDPYWSARDPYYSPYGWSGFGPYGYWGYPGWWGPPVYYVYPERDVSTAEPARLRPLQERMLYIAPVPLPRWTLPPPARPLPSRDQGVFPPDRSDQPGPAPDGRFWLRPGSPPEARPLPSRDRGVFPPDRSDQPGPAPDGRFWSRSGSPPEARPLLSRDRGVFSPDRSDQPDSSPDRRPWAKPPPALNPPPVPSPPAIHSPSMRERRPEARSESPYPRRPWRRRDTDGE